MKTVRRRIVLASRNADKLREMRELCAGLPFDLAAASDYPGLPEVVEDGTTVLGNASRKAIVTAAWTGEIAVADDTAFQVSALNDLPDIFASRFAGPDATYADNVDLLLALLRDVPDGHRQARFITAAVWVDPRPRAGGGPFPVTGPQGVVRWLHNPFARAIEVRDPAREAAYWDTGGDRRRAWAAYRARWGDILVTHGGDTARLRAAFERLLAGVPAADGSAAAAPGLRLPDPRIWTTDGPAGAVPPPTLTAPSGLSPEAPGRGVNEPVWLEVAACGRLLGEITREPVGWGGFGYDPVFRPCGGDRTLAELEPAAKNAVSHRGRALRRLLSAAVAAGVPAA
ncbi:MAG: non-canonical purine NTP pyrophosphatase [Candidatus Krumholzibacteriia bacterium]